MFTFRIGRIPVTVHPSHLILAGLIAYYSGAQGGRGVSVPFAIGAWLVVVFVSILVHELGHAFASQTFGFKPEVNLAGLGGYTATHMAPDTPWHRQFAITAAGPLFGALLGVLGMAVSHLPVPRPVEYLAQAFMQANFVWAVLNLIPVPPLDGSHLVSTVMKRVFGNRGVLISAVIGLLVGGVLVLLGLKIGEYFLVIIFGMGAVQAFQQIAAYQRGDLQATGGQAAQLHLKALGAAAEALNKGDLDQATQLASAVATSQATRPVIARAEYLLGWISLRQKKGREALDHFSMAGGVTVEQEALATAFSLLGDHERSASLWELAYRERKDAAAAAAWAAQLVLLGREEAAARVPGVDLAAAHQVASHVQLDRNRPAEALRLGLRSLELSPSEQAAYDTACAAARAGETGRAIELLHRATALGFTDGEHARRDPDLASVREDPAFAAWLASLPSGSAPT